MKWVVKYEDFVETYCKRYQTAKQYPLVLNLYKKGFPIQNISKRTKLSDKLIYNWIKKKAIPIPYLH